VSLAGDGLRAERFQATQEQMLAQLRRHRRWLAPHPDLPHDVCSILRRISKDLFDPGLNVKTLKARCGIRDNNVSSRFRLWLGKSIRAYVEMLRMEAASRLLRQTDFNVLAVATLVGYDRLETFYRAFRRCFACTPAEHRDRAPRGECGSRRNAKKKDQDHSP